MSVSTFLTLRAPDFAAIRRISLTLIIPLPQGPLPRDLHGEHQQTAPKPRRIRHHLLAPCPARGASGYSWGSVRERRFARPVVGICQRGPTESRAVAAALSSP